MNFPKLIHLIYLPWSKRTQKLKPNEMDFNQKPYKKLVKKNPEWKIKLWTYSELKKFVDNEYPNLWNFIWNNIDRPVQSVDFFRLLVVYHFGGIYWQYGSTNLVNFDEFIPNSETEIMLFTECIISEEFSEKMKNEPIRDNKPEELTRICTQVYSAFPNNKFLEYTIEKSKKNITKFTVKCDYDILYIGGNAMFSEAYHEYINNEKDNRIKLISKEKTNKMIEIKSKGSWRTDKNY